MEPTGSLRGWGAASAAVLLAACAPAIERLGPGISAAGVQSREVALGVPPTSEPVAAAMARDAVEAALLEEGYELEAEARYRLDVAFAIAPTPVDVGEHRVQAGSAALPSVALCKRQRYVLSVALLDGHDGRVLFRNRASTKRCGQVADEVLPALARAVVQG